MVLLQALFTGHAPWPFSGAKARKSSDAGTPHGQAGASRLEPELKIRRLQMVEQQIHERGITDKHVLAALRRVPRHQFVDPAWIDAAYSDHALPIGQGQTISQPYIVAYMTEAVQIAPDAIVLEIGTGSGYQTAILAELARTVYSIERLPALAERAQATLRHLGYTNVHIRVGDGYEGWPEYAPYNAIVVTAAPPAIPPALGEQLALNGRLVIPVGEQHQDIQVITYTPTGFNLEATLPVQFVPMVAGTLGKPRSRSVSPGESRRVFTGDSQSLSAEESS
ncbi:protein-L-isoaspartate(D-aspartate) O-methyltransferase [Trichothermofontia sp.]